MELQAACKLVKLCIRVFQLVDLKTNDDPLKVIYLRTYER